MPDEPRAVRTVRTDHRAEQDACEDGPGQDGVEGERMRPVPLEAAGAGRVRAGVEEAHKSKR